ncbi:hypothetical protein PIB30_082208 [Stylosanthes scabra]|uniref:Uncharacterized protein n=1 Tax=Stylosanthes scabra TaxID=79078 RepID=A0ABU6UVN0_9FABA|nr:hypothetical protein [Stylosanthes scabra]
MQEGLCSDGTRYLFVIGLLVQWIKVRGYLDPEFLRRRSGWGHREGHLKRDSDAELQCFINVGPPKYRTAKLWALGLVQNSAPNLGSRLVGFASFLNKTFAQNAPSPLEGGFRKMARKSGKGVSEQVENEPTPLLVVPSNAWTKPHGTELYGWVASEVLGTQTKVAKEYLDALLKEDIVFAPNHSTKYKLEVSDVNERICFVNHKVGEVPNWL